MSQKTDGKKGMAVRRKSERCYCGFPRVVGRGEGTQNFPPLHRRCGKALMAPAERATGKRGNKGIGRKTFPLSSTQGGGRGRKGVKKTVRQMEQAFKKACQPFNFIRACFFFPAESFIEASFRSESVKDTLSETGMSLTFAPP